MPFTADDPRLVYVPFDRALNPEDGLYRCLTKRWWVVHPEKGLVCFKIDKRSRGDGAPQCNNCRAIMERGLANYPGCELRFIERAFLAIDIRDYAT